jgi:exodeoxyribonuclease V
MPDFDLILDEDAEEFSTSPKVTFTATPDQQEALDLMTTWLLAGYKSHTKFEHTFPFFLLKGYAGTGKSFAITELAKSGPFKPSEILFTAPTNKAVKVLRNYLDDAGLGACRTATIYSALGLSLQANGEVKEITKPEEPVDLSMYKVIVVDEGSMINRFLMAAIEEAYYNWRVPFIFMGDPAQLPPVGEITSPIWSIENSYTLTKVLRYGDSMLELATAIRKVVDHPFPSIKIDFAPPVHKVTRPQWLDRIIENLDLFKSGDAKVISWRNVTVDKYNAFIRERIYGFLQAKQNAWLPDDKIVATAMIKDLDDNIIMRTDEESTVLEIVQGHHPIYPEFEIFNLLVLNEHDRKLQLRVLTPSGSMALNNRLNELAMEAKGGKRYKWREFWELKEAFSEVRHSYAITSHRSQGSSYLKTFIDLEDIMLNRNKAEAFRSLYVACTRQREEIWIT